MKTGDDIHGRVKARVLSNIRYDHGLQFFSDPPADAFPDKKGNLANALNIDALAGHHMERALVGRKLINGARLGLKRLRGFF